MTTDLLAALDAKDRRATTDPAGFFAALPESYTAQGEALIVLADQLAQTLPDVYARLGPQIDIVPAFRRVRLDDPLMPPLLLAAGLVAEDIALLQVVEGDWRITAAAITSGGRATDRLGMPSGFDDAVLEALPGLVPTMIGDAILLRLAESGAVLLRFPASG